MESGRKRKRGTSTVKPQCTLSHSPQFRTLKKRINLFRILFFRRKRKFSFVGTGLNLSDRGRWSRAAARKQSCFLRRNPVKSDDNQKQNFYVHHSTDPQSDVARALGWAAIYVQDFDAPCVLQFAWISALCCALHRSTSQVIHRSGSFLKIIFIFFFPFCGKPRNEEKYIYSSNHGYGEESVCESTERAGLFNAVCRVRSVRGAGRRRVFQHTHIYTWAKSIKPSLTAPSFLPRWREKKRGGAYIYRYPSKSACRV